MWQTEGAVKNKDEQKEVMRLDFTKTKTTQNPNIRSATSKPNTRALTVWESEEKTSNDN